MKSRSRYEIRFSGSGGQGIITAAVVMADAIGAFDGKNVCQTQSYGPEARGGKSKAELVISDGPIDYPKALQVDLLLAMTQAACDAYFFDLKTDGLLIVDSGLVEQVPTSRAVSLPFTQIARQQIGRELVANMVALGAVGYLSGQVSLESLHAALLARVPKGTEEMNRKALQAGIDAAAKIDLSTLPRSIISDWETEL
ncbi:MAG: 2-oxoacid:ferredoxin oxidoreductase subunit gamma [Desulfobulbaceae bacterium]|nr:MAG: 2-oxoacid:ferredoxin oxidoreductase subunit gamma [Desulfobulbaceae bacterium]